MTDAGEDCIWCERELDQPFLLEACASVALSRRISSYAALAAYLRTAHERGHVDARERHRRLTETVGRKAWR
jgi:hypothetical protein